jgi:hypothetical protein
LEPGLVRSLLVGGSWVAVTYVLCDLDLGDEPDPVQQIADLVVDWWLDIEALDWDRDAAVVRLPIDPGDTKVRFRIARSEAPDVFHHQLTISSVVDVVARHDGGYPFAQPIEAVSFDAVRQEIRIDLAFDSVLRVRVRCSDAGVMTLSPMEPN